jgi:hypothetical protein
MIGEQAGWVAAPLRDQFAGLLPFSKEDKNPRYATFREHRLRLNVAPVRVNERAFRKEPGAGEPVRRTPTKRCAWRAHAAATVALTKKIHIYEMWRSDLFGVARKGLRVFGELYQLSFHLGSVGVNNVSAATISLGKTCGKP